MWVQLTQAEEGIIMENILSLEVVIPERSRQRLNSMKCSLSDA